MVPDLEGGLPRRLLRPPQGEEVRVAGVEAAGRARHRLETEAPVVSRRAEDKDRAGADRLRGEGLGYQLRPDPMSLGRDSHEKKNFEKLIEMEF